MTTNTIRLHRVLHATPERVYRAFLNAEAMAKCAKAVAPLAYEAFEEHLLNSVKLSQSECIELAAMLEGKACSLEGRPLAIFEQKLAKMRSFKPIEEPEEPVLPSG